MARGRPERRWRARVAWRGIPLVAPIPAGAVLKDWHFVSFVAKKDVVDWYFVRVVQ